MKTLTTCLMISILYASAVTTLAHVDGRMYFKKTLTAELSESTSVTLTYYTASANYQLVEETPIGEFAQYFAVLEVTGHLETGERTIVAGKYTLGAIRKGKNDWTMALYPGEPSFDGPKPDRARAISLDSVFSTLDDHDENIRFDITPGSGKLRGRATISWRFGHMVLAGAVS